MSACAILVRLVLLSVSVSYGQLSTNGTFITTLYNYICTMTYKYNVMSRVGGVQKTNTWFRDAAQ